MLGCVFLCEIVEWMRLGREVLDESSVEVGEIQKSSNISEVARLRPVGDSGSLAMIHAHVAGFDDHAKVFNAVAVEFAFLRLQVQVVFF